MTITCTILPIVACSALGVGPVLPIFAIMTVFILILLPGLATWLPDNLRTRPA